MGKKLAIKGHLTRGNEVIKLLEMMGGTNVHNLSGNNSYAYYTNDSHQNVIRGAEYIFDNDDMQYFTLEEFLEKYPYKVGDTVAVWVEDWENGRGSYVSVKIECIKWDNRSCEIIYATKVGGMHIFFEAKDVKDNKLSGTICDTVETKSYTVSLKDDKAIDSSQFMQFGKTVAVCFNTANYENEVELQLGDYEIVVRDGKTYAVLKKPTYPKTYEECCKVLRISPEFLIKYSVDGSDTERDAPLIRKFIKLKRCRDAYWEIAGKEMGLGKPWEPDWNESKPKYTIVFIENKFEKRFALTQNYILAFPTEEMRDEFFDNFKDLIESCKALL